MTPSITTIYNEEYLSEVCGLDHHYLCDEAPPLTVVSAAWKRECQCWCHPYEAARKHNLKQAVTGQEP